jgi:hypothetical protein
VIQAIAYQQALLAHAIEVAAQHNQHENDQYDREALLCGPSWGGVAERAGEFAADVRGATFGRDHPGMADSGGVVAYVLRVAAFEIGDPVADLVLVEADDFTGGMVLKPTRALGL